MEADSDIVLPVKYWEIVAEKLSAAGWSWGYCSAVTRDGWRWIVDAHAKVGATLFILTNCLASFWIWKRQCCGGWVDRVRVGHGELELWEWMARAIPIMNTFG